MDGTYLRQSLLVVLTKAEITEVLIKHLFHLLLIFHTPQRVVEETFVEGDTCMLMPP